MPFVQLLKEVSTVYNIRLDILFIKVCRLIVYQADNSLGQIQADNLIKQTIGVSSRQLKMGRTVCTYCPRLLGFKQTIRKMVKQTIDFPDFKQTIQSSRQFAHQADNFFPWCLYYFFLPSQMPIFFSYFFQNLFTIIFIIGKK